MLLNLACRLDHKIIGVYDLGAPRECAFGAANPLPVNSLATPSRNIASVLKVVKSFLCNQLTH
jgi:hypothetical protein